MRKLILLLAILSCSLPAVADGQTVRIKRFSIDDGLQQSHIHRIIQDREGCIWLSSWDGLKRYDGHRFHNYKARPGDGCPLESNRINHIEELDDRGILCPTIEKCYVFNPATCKFTPTNIKPKHYERHVPADVEAKILAMPDYANVDAKVKLVDRQGGGGCSRRMGLNVCRSILLQYARSASRKAARRMSDFCSATAKATSG